MGPTWGPPGSCRSCPRWAPCWPHELCYQGRYSLARFDNPREPWLMTDSCSGYRGIVGRAKNRRHACGRIVYYGKGIVLLWWDYIIWISKGAHISQNTTWVKSRQVLNFITPHCLAGGASLHVYGCATCGAANGWDQCPYQPGYWVALAIIASAHPRIYNQSLTFISFLVHIYTNTKY